MKYIVCKHFDYRENTYLGKNDEWVSNENQARHFGKAQAVRHANEMINGFIMKADKAVRSADYRKAHS